jgi:hypothetical protein
MNALRRAFGAVVALLILFEEWGWEPLQAALGRAARWLHVEALERWLARLPPYAALVVFAVPGLLLLPLKLLAVALMSRGQVLAGLLLIVVAKLLGTAIVARLFTLLRPALLRLGWFARAHARWLAWKAELLAQLRAMPAWHAAVAAHRELAERLRRWRQPP